MSSGIKYFEISLIIGKATVFGFPIFQLTEQCICTHSSHTDRDYL